MDNRIEQLEYTVMELGTEIFRLKSQINEMTDRQSHLNGLVNTIRCLLDEKGIVEADDIDLNTDLNDGEIEGDEASIDLEGDRTNTKNEYH